MPQDQHGLAILQEVEQLLAGDLHFVAGIVIVGEQVVFEGDRFAGRPVPQQGFQAKPEVERFEAFGRGLDLGLQPGQRCRCACRAGVQEIAKHDQQSAIMVGQQGVKVLDNLALDLVLGDRAGLGITAEKSVTGTKSIAGTGLADPIQKIRGRWCRSAIVRQPLTELAGGKAGLVNLCVTGRPDRYRHTEPTGVRVRNNLRVAKSGRGTRRD